MKIIERKLALGGKEKVAIINARFNHIITDRLVEGARDAFLRHGGDEANLFALTSSQSSIKQLEEASVKRIRTWLHFNAFNTSRI